MGSNDITHLNIMLTYNEIKEQTDKLTSFTAITNTKNKPKNTKNENMKRPLSGHF
jgi:hypothetical protein